MTIEFCEARAVEAATAAADAKLDNVRDRELRSEAAWRGMVARLVVVQTAREKRDLERAELVLSPA